LFILFKEIVASKQKIVHELKMRKYCIPNISISFVNFDKI